MMVAYAVTVSRMRWWRRFWQEMVIKVLRVNVFVVRVVGFRCELAI